MTSPNQQQADPQQQPENQDADLLSPIPVRPHSARAIDGSAGKSEAMDSLGLRVPASDTLTDDERNDVEKVRRQFPGDRLLAIIDRLTASNSTLAAKLAEAEKELIHARKSFRESHDLMDKYKAGYLPTGGHPQLIDRVRLMIDERDSLRHRAEQAEARIVQLRNETFAHEATIVTMDAALRDVVEEIESNFTAEQLADGGSESLIGGFRDRLRIALSPDGGEVEGK